MYTVIIPAAGQGSRMQTDRNKVMLEIAGKAVIRMTVEIFETDPRCEAVYLAAKEEEIDILKQLLAGLTKVKNIIRGGSERQYSIYNVLKELKDPDIVMVHDAARPFVSHETLKKLYDKALTHRAAIAAVRAKDTIKVITNDYIAHTPDRNQLWMVQTPQAFQYELLMEAYRQAAADSYLGTDDASLVERLNKRVFIVESSYDNIKLTTPEDIYFAEAILKKRGETC